MQKTKLRMLGFLCAYLYVASCMESTNEKSNIQDNIRIDSSDNNAVFTFNGDKICSYAYQESFFKPYVKELFTPNSVNVLLDSPDDHKHHHGLMYAIKVNGTNFWEEVEKSGRQEPHGIKAIFCQTQKDGNASGFESDLHWMDGNKDALAIEQRSISLENCRQFNVRLLTWKSNFKPVDSNAPLSLTGSHYHGLGMRFRPEMDEIGEFFTAENKEGAIFRGEERLIPDRWCAYTAPINGKNVTVAMFGHPENPNGDTIWFTMKTSFAYMSATMALHETPYILQPDETLLLQYGVALWDGQVDKSTIEEAYQYWVAHIK